MDSVSYWLRRQPKVRKATRSRLEFTPIPLFPAPERRAQPGSAVLLVRVTTLRSSTRSYSTSSIISCTRNRPSPPPPVRPATTRCRPPGGRKIEGSAVVPDHDDERAGLRPQADLDPMRLVVVVSVADRVGQDLVDRQVDRIGDVRRDVPRFAERVDLRRHPGELLQIVGEGDLDSVLVHGHSIPVRGDPRLVPRVAPGRRAARQDSLSAYSRVRRHHSREGPNKSLDCVARGHDSLIENRCSAVGADFFRPSQ